MNEKDSLKYKGQVPYPIGALFKLLRAELGENMTQLELARKSGTSRSLIARTESLNVAPSDKVLQQIAEALTQNTVEKAIILKKLRQSALYSKNPDQFMAAMESQSYSPTLGPIDFVNLTEYQRNMVLETLQSKQFTIKSFARQADIDPYHLLDILEGESEISLKDLDSLCQHLGFDINEFILGLGHYPGSLTDQLKSNPEFPQIIAALLIKCKSLEGDALKSYLASVLTTVRND